MATVAGSGALGLDDGPAKRATFTGPVAVAIGPDNAIYVADEFGQAIRRIKNGVVSTIAGASAPGFTPQFRLGGYVDGPVRIAKFDRPSGVAVGRDGSVYVADYGNGAVRKISGGIVRTFPRFTFDGPRDIAMDDDGNLYVADSSAGIRKVTRAGAVSTLPGTNVPDICGVAARGSGRNVVVAYTDLKQITVIAGSDKQVLSFNAAAEPVEDRRPVGAACRLAIYDRYTLVVSDLFTNTVRFVRFPIYGSVGSGAMVRALAGGNIQASELGGDKDGGIGTAAVDAPGGLAIASNGTIVFADTGNRKIREIRNVDPRGPLYPGLAGVIGPADRYRIVIVGASYDFHNALWTETMGAQIESGLAADGVKYGLARCPYVAAVRYSGMAIADAASLIQNYFGDGGADLVIYEVDYPVLEHELDLHPELAKNDL